MEYTVCIVCECVWHVSKDVCGVNEGVCVEYVIVHNQSRQFV